MDHSEIKHLPKVDHTPAELDEASRLLLKAADVMAQRGKCEWIRTDNAGRVCVLGALDRAGNFRALGGDDHQVWKEAVRRLARDLPPHPVPDLQNSPPHKAANWNNDPNRSGDEIIAKLRAVALGL